jgi:hypothetical protein
MDSEYTKSRGQGMIKACNDVVYIHIYVHMLSFICTHMLRTFSSNVASMRALRLRNINTSTLSRVIAFSFGNKWRNGIGTSCVYVEYI